MKTAVVTGAGSGLGLLIAKALKPHYDVIGVDRKFGHDVRTPSTLPSLPRMELDVLVNCAGVNKINWIEAVTSREWDEVMDTNAKAIFTTTQTYLSALRVAEGTVLNIVSNASHMPMRCSAAYNASKGAAAILTRQMARELAPAVTVFAVSPNKLAGTGMSEDIDQQVMETRGWTREDARAYQLSGLLTGEETPPERVAEFIGFLLSTKERHKYLTGCDIPYGA